MSAASFQSPPSPSTSAASTATAPAPAPLRRAATCLAAALAALAGCGEPEVASAAAALDARNAIELVYAKLVSRSCASCNEWVGVAEVRNVASRKTVTVQADRSDGFRQSGQGTYLRTLPGGNELWRFGGLNGQPGETKLELTLSSGVGGGFDTNLGARYTARSASLSGRGVVGIESPMYRTRDVAVLDARVLPGSPAPELAITLLVRNRTHHKTVRAVYSTDDWATVRQAPGSYQYGDGPGGETWLVRERLPAGTRQLAFAVNAAQGAYDGWDNNYGSNFTCRYETADGTWRCAGYALLD